MSLLLSSPHVRGSGGHFDHFIEAWIEQASSSAGVDADVNVDVDVNVDIHHNTDIITSSSPFSKTKTSGYPSSFAAHYSRKQSHDYNRHDTDCQNQERARKRRRTAMTTPPPRKSPTKRSRRESTDDFELTPRPTRHALPLQQTDAVLDSASQPPSLQPDDTYSETTPSLSGASDISGTSAASRRSRYNSPTKRIRALQEATQLRLQTRDLTSQALQSLPKDIRDLIADLKDYQDRIGIIPRALKEVVSIEPDMLTPVRDFWLHDNDTDISTADHLSRHRVLRKVCRESIMCGRRLRHESVWNCRVHFPLLDEALSRLPAVGVENITSIRVADQFQDRDPVLKENKVDFGIFLTPADESKLKSDILAYCQAHPHVAINPLRGFEPHWPLAISIETKRSAGSSENALPQIANWARAHVRQLLHLPSLRSSSVGDLGQNTLPVLPLVTVLGSKWEVSFANRQGEDMVIYEKVDLGDTDTTVGCYQVYCSLARLGGWVETAFSDWCAATFKPEAPVT